MLEIDCNQIQKILYKGVEDGVFPGCVLRVGNVCENVLLYAGYRQILPKKEPANENTLYDLASLTKIVATVPSIMSLVEKGLLTLDTTIAEVFPELDISNYREITILNLLTHTSGFHANYPLHEKSLKSDEDVLNILIKNNNLLHITDNRVLYSDINYILLGIIVNKISGMRLNRYSAENIFKPLHMDDTAFNPIEKENVAATEIDKTTGKIIKGVVHDENARQLGGVCGHAGLFSTAVDLSRFCSMLLNKGHYHGTQVLKPETIDTIFRNYTPCLNENRGLGWMVYTPGSFMGKKLSKNSFGHTGFTGTSIVLDFDKKIYIVLLTNRVHPTRENNKIFEFRKYLHNAIAELL